LVFAANYYIKNDGNDSASGLTDADAWATVAKVNDFAEGPTGFKSGDTISFKRGHIWTNDETLGSDGSDISWGTIGNSTIQDYGTGKKPRLNGNTQTPIRINSPITNLTIRNLDCSGMERSAGHSNISIGDAVTNLVLDGIYIDGHDGVSTDVNLYHAVAIGDLSGDVEITNSELKNAVRKTGPGDYKDMHLLIFYWSHNSSKNSGRVRIHHNIMHDANGDLIHLAGLAADTQIYNNTLYHFGENAIDLKACQNVKIYNNEIYRGDYGSGGSSYPSTKQGNIIWHNPGNWPVEPRSIEVYDNKIHSTSMTGVSSGGGDNHKIYRNHFKDCRTSFQITTGSNVEFSDNLLELTKDYDYISENNPFYSLIMILHIDYFRIHNLSIVNNTAYSSSQTNLYGIWFKGDNEVTDVVMQNNIVYLERDSSAVYPLYVASGDGELPTVDHNSFYNPAHANRVFWDRTVYDGTEEAAWRDAGHTMGLFSDPLLLAPQNGNFRLSDDSPCRQVDRIFGALHIYNQKLSAPANLRLSFESN
jgi:hypothetical protein